MRLKYVVSEVDDRRRLDGSLPLLTVSIHRGVQPAPSEQAGGDSEYKVCRAGQLVLNRMRAFQGALGVAPVDGLASPDYAVLEVSAEHSPDFVAYLLRSPWGVAAMAARIRGIGGVENGNVRTPRINVQDLGEIECSMPNAHDQQKVADFLDRECARIDELQAEIDAYVASLAEPAVSRFAELTLGMPRGRIGYRFEVQLGKMLDEKQIDPDNMSAYLRNRNVQWDRIEMDDIKAMTFSAQDRVKFALQPGDLLVCEGGQPGRSAVWQGEQDDCYFQKALMRVRPRAADSTRFLMWCLRVASERGDFAADGTGSAIQHLPAERLVATRVPSCELAEQLRILDEVDALSERARQAGHEATAMRRQLTEYRDALITEAVSGKLPTIA